MKVGSVARYVALINWQPSVGVWVTFKLNLDLHALEWKQKQSEDRACLSIRENLL